MAEVSVHDADADTDADARVFFSLFVPGLLASPSMLDGPRTNSSIFLSRFYSCSRMNRQCSLVMPRSLRKRNSKRNVEAAPVHVEKH